MDEVPSGGTGQEAGTAPGVDSPQLLAQQLKRQRALCMPGVLGVGWPAVSGGDQTPGTILTWLCIKASLPPVGRLGNFRPC